MAPTAIDIGLRDGLPGDVAFLAAAHRSGQDAVADARGGRLDTLMRGHGEPIEDSFSELLSDVNTSITIGEVDGVPVGYMVTTIEALRSGEQLSVITDLWVEPAARGVGVGATLMSHAMDQAQRAGSMGIDARALPGDRVTKNFFESFGLVARTIEVHKPL